MQGISRVTWARSQLHRGVDVLKDVNTRRGAGAIIFGSIGVYCGSQVGYLGVALVAVAFLLGVAGIVLNPSYMRPPDSGRSSEGAAAVGAVFGLIVANVAAGLNLPELAYGVVGVFAAVLGGVLVGLRLLRYPDA